MIVAGGSHPTELEDAMGDDSARGGCDGRIRSRPDGGIGAFPRPDEAHFALGASFSLAAAASFSLAAAAGTLALRTVVMSVTATGLRL
jgi:hypothetical protein